MFIFWKICFVHIGVEDSRTDGPAEVLETRAMQTYGIGYRVLGFSGTR